MIYEEEKYCAMPCTEDDFINLIRTADYAKARELFMSMDIKKQKDFLFLVSYDTGSMAFYSFLNYLIARSNDSYYLHELAVLLLGFAINHIEGAYSAALYHAKILCEMNPDSIKDKEMMLFFYDIPERLITKSYAEKIAREILEKDPQNAAALSTLKRMGKDLNGGGQY